LTYFDSIIIKKFSPDNLFVVASMEGFTLKKRRVLVLHPQIVPIFKQTNIAVALQTNNIKCEFFFEQFNVFLFPFKIDSNWAIVAFKKLSELSVEIFLFDPCKKNDSFWDETKQNIIRIWKVMCFGDNNEQRDDVKLTPRDKHNLNVPGQISNNSSGFYLSEIAEKFLDEEEFDKNMTSEDIRNQAIIKVTQLDVKKNWQKYFKFEILFHCFLPWKNNSCYFDVVLVSLYLFLQNQIKKVNPNSEIKSTLTSIFQLIDRTKDLQDRKRKISSGEIDLKQTKEFDNLKEKLFSQLGNGIRKEDLWGDWSDPNLVMNNMKISIPQLKILNLEIFSERKCECGREEKLKNCDCDFTIFSECICGSNPTKVSVFTVSGHAETEKELFEQPERCVCGRKIHSFFFLTEEVEFFFYSFVSMTTPHFFPSIEVPIKDKQPVRYNAVYSIRQPSEGHFSSSWKEGGEHVEYDGIGDYNVKKYNKKWKPIDSKFVLYKRTK
jgi:hypothetical protein